MNLPQEKENALNSLYMTDVITIEQAMVYLGLSYGFVENLIKEGEIALVQEGLFKGYIFFKSIIDYLDRQNDIECIDFNVNKKPNRIQSQTGGTRTYKNESLSINGSYNTTIGNIMDDFRLNPEEFMYLIEKGELVFSAIEDEVFYATDEKGNYILDANDNLVVYSRCPMVTIESMTAFHEKLTGKRVTKKVRRREGRRMEQKRRNDLCTPNPEDLQED